ncbi:MAG: Histidine kinase [Pedosphaera sp.]|nr:Histidine kinase [Pedosphaera sp.]
MARPDKQQKPTFFWQGLLIVLPVMVLAGFGFSFLRQDKKLAENEARERAQLLADDLSGKFSKDFFTKLSRLYFDTVNARANQHQNSPYTDTYFHIQVPGKNSGNASGTSIDAPMRKEILKRWPESMYGELWSYHGMKLDAGGRLVSVGCKIDERGDTHWEGATRPAAYLQTPSPLASPTLIKVQRELWDKARDAEFSNANPEKAIALYRQFLELSPPPSFAAVAQYSLGMLLAKAGEIAKAEELFQTLEETTNFTTEAGLPLHLLAQLQQVQMWCDKRNTSGLEHTNDITTGLQSLCSNTISQPSAITPAILSRVRELQGGAGLGNKALAMLWGWQSAWEADESSREFYEENRKEFGPEQMRDRAFWTIWRDQSWLVIVEGIDTFDDNSQPHDTGYYQLCVFPELLVREAVWETIISTRVSVPEYALVSVNLSGRSINPQSKGSTVLAETATKWNLYQRTLDGLAVQVLLDKPVLLYARQRMRTLWLSSLIGVAALAALIGFFAARRAFQRQLYLSEMKSNFVSSVSHELRAPIASVRLMAEGLERGKIQAPEKQNEYFRFIVQECRRLSSLIENVLDFSRIEQGRKQYEPEPTDLVALVEQTVKLMQTYAAEQNIQVTLQIIGNPVPIDVDGKAIQQALVNLVDNAVKHSQKGAAVEVGLEFHESRVRLWVEDHGEGIPREEHEKIFERFYRLGSELRRETQGVGIGLSIVKHIVQAHHGKVTVRSEVGQGSRFTIELPVGRNG